MYKFSVFVFLLPIFAFSQIEISGKVQDTLQPIEFANVILTNANNDIVSGAITDVDGGFRITVSKGVYTLMISFLGYKDWSKEIQLYEDTNLGNITLIGAAAELDEVVVTNKKPLVERKVDRLVFNAKNSITAIGGDGLDVLKKAPGIRVNNDNIDIIGKGSVRVLVNDRLLNLSGEDLSGYLKSISSNDIDRIEVITTPPAKYDAEGNSGLINIVLKSTKRDSFNATLRSATTQATYISQNIGAGFNYQKKKITINADANYVKGSYRAIETNKVFYPEDTWDAKSKRRDFLDKLSARIGVDYQLSERSLVGVQYHGIYNTPEINEVENTHLIKVPQNTIDSTIVSKGLSDREKVFNSINGHYQVTLDTIGTKITVDADYFKFKNNQNRDADINVLLPDGVFSSNSGNTFNNASMQDIETFTSRIDVEMPTDFANISFGGKVSYITNTSVVQFFDLNTGIPVLDPANSNVFNYDENIQAVYINASKSIGEKWQTQLGLRLENTNTKGFSETLNQTNKNTYLKLFPTVYATYTPNDNHSFSLNYSRRIGRPGYASLNPFRWYSNQYSYSEGNPLLQPLFTHNLEFSHLYKDNLSTAIYVSKTENGYGQITLVEPDSNIQATVIQNYYEGYQFGLSESYTLNVLKSWESYNELYLYYSYATSDLDFLLSEQSAVSAYVSSSNSFTLNKAKTFLGEFTYWYQFPEALDLDQTNGYSQLDIGLKFLLLDKKLQLGISGIDVLSSRRPRYTSFTNAIKQEYENYYDNRKLRISLTYSFGSNKVKTRRSSTSNKEEKRRTGN